jgi:hypothetical protein
MQLSGAGGDPARTHAILRGWPMGAKGEQALRFALGDWVVFEHG